MRALLRAIFFVILVMAMAGCSTTSFKDDGDSRRDAGSSDAQLQYGGQYRVRVQASH